MKTLAVSVLVFFAVFSNAYSKSLANSLTKKIFDDVVKIRSLNSDIVLNIGFKSKGEVKSYVVKRFNDEYSKKELELERKSLVFFGFLNEDFSYRRFILKYISSQVAGYYDPYSKGLYLAKWLPFELQEPTIAHELVHLLQDTNFKLDPFIKRDKENDDLTLAKNSLVEGDATKVTLDYMIKKDSKLNDSSLLKRIYDTHMSEFYLFGSMTDEIPEFIKEALIFPYIAGFEFVKAIKDRKGWKSVNEAFLNYPKSTEQIMHPEKYPSEKPIVVKFKKKILKENGWRIKRKNKLGEFFSFLLLKKYLDANEAKTASKGWGGDAYVVLENRKKEYALLSLIVFDTEQDAKEYYASYNKLLKGRFEKDIGEKNLLRRDAKTVLFATGLDKDSLKVLKNSKFYDLADII